MHVVPWGLRKLLLYIQDRYNDPDIFITESGVDVPHESRLPLAKALKDSFRIDYFKVKLHARIAHVGRLWISDSSAGKIDGAKLLELRVLKLAYVFKGGLRFAK